MHFKETTVIAKATGYFARLGKETIAFGLQNSLNRGCRFMLTRKQRVDTANVGRAVLLRKTVHVTEEESNIMNTQQREIGHSGTTWTG
jgi:hypothetical protein